MTVLEWSDDLKKAARSLSYFSAFSASVGYLDIDSSSAFFGIKINNFNQSLIYYVLVAAAAYWFVILLLRLSEEWLRFSSEHNSLIEQSEENREIYKAIASEAATLKDSSSLERLILMINQYDPTPQKAEDAQKPGPQSNTTEINLKLRQQAIFDFVNQAKQVAERLSQKLDKSLDFIARNRTLLRIRRATVVRLALFEAGMPIALFLVSLSAAYFGNHQSP
ncbi:hypothetical protein GVN24_00255 [Rhizobium sp. CRIBSB]|nr:hypothetical protein [Rhizobium sp. CRIBSB]